MSDIKHIPVILIAPCSSHPHGLVEDGFYKEDGETVALVTQKGVQRYDLKRKPIRHKLKDGENPRRVAWMLVKNNVAKRNTGFNRRIPYFNPGKI